MNVSTTEWIITVAATLSVILIDVIRIVRKPHEPSTRESAVTLGLYVSFAVLFGIWITSYHGTQYGIEFFAGWLTEYSLSVDNLFIFLIIMASFKVPRKYQQEALMVGIILALIFRAIFIAVGAVAIERVSSIFYLFGAFLIYTAWTLLKDEDHSDDYENAFIRFTKKHWEVSENWNGLKLLVVENGVRMISPMLLVIIALGTTDLMFALDSIPAIYGLTKEPYIVFTANVFALMGLRQLYFLLGDLVNRLVYLSYGLAIVLAFIGIKLILHALHTNTLPFINGGEHVNVPEIHILFSLGFIIVTLTVTAVASLIKTRVVEQQTNE